MNQSVNKTSLPVLPQIQINEPCHADWGSMGGDEQKRLCGSCQKHVHELSQMDAKSANDLLSKCDDSVCVRVRRNADGSVVTKDSDLSRRGWLSACGTTVTSLMAMLLFGGCGNPFVTMGEPLPTDFSEQPSVEMGGACPEDFPEQPSVRMGKIRVTEDVSANVAAEDPDNLTKEDGRNSP